MSVPEQFQGIKDLIECKSTFQSMIELTPNLLEQLIKIQLKSTMEVMVNKSDLG